MRVRYVEHEGRTQSVKAWARQVNIDPGTLHRRLNLGWPIAVALTQPVKPQTPTHKNPIYVLLRELRANGAATASDLAARIKIPHKHVCTYLARMRSYGLAKILENSSFNPPRAGGRPTRFWIAA